MDIMQIARIAMPALMIVVLVEAACAATEVGGLIAVDTTWSDPVYHVTDGILVDSGVTLSIAPGTVVKFDDRKGLSVNGSLLAEAVSASPIVFTDIRDDSAGGDSNGDGNATVPEPGWWTGIYLRSGADASLEHIEVRYAGRYVQYIDEAAIHKAGDGTLSLRHSLIRNTSRRALAFRGTTGDLVIEGNTIFQTLNTEAVFLRDNAGTISLINNRIRGAAGYGIYALGTNQLIVTGNLISNSGHSGMLFWGPAISATVFANTIEGSTTHGINLQDTTDAVELSFNSVQANGENGLYMTRSITPITNNTIRSNGTRGIYVAGVESTPLIAGNQIYGNDVGILCAGSANPLIGGSADHANDIHSNTTAGVENTTDTLVIDARFNWWGNANGPHHPDTNPEGQGNPVSDWVNYADYLHEAALDRILDDRFQVD